MQRKAASVTRVLIAAAICAMPAHAAESYGNCKGFITAVITTQARRLAIGIAVFLGGRVILAGNHPIGDGSISVTRRTT